MTIGTVTGGWRFYQAGRQVVREVPGMRRILIKGLLLNLLLFLLLASTLNLVCYLLLWRPIWIWLLEWLPPALAWVAGVLVGILALALIMVSLMFAFRFSIRLMSLWYEEMVRMVVVLCCPDRPCNATGFDLGEMLWAIFRELRLMGALLLIGFVPLVGGVLVFYCSSCLMGYSVFEPYLAVLKSSGWREQVPYLKRWSVQLFLLGLPQFLVALIPLLGWLALPWIMLHLVLGQSWMYARELGMPGQASVVRRSSSPAMARS